MAKDIQSLISVRPAFQVKKGPVKQESGLSAQYVATALYDFALLDSSGIANSAIGAHGLGVFLPTKALITRAWYQVVTGFTSAANTATVALMAQTANDIKIATLVSAAGFVAAGPQDGVSSNTAATTITLTAQRELVATVAVQALTAGKLVIYVE